MSSLPRNRFLLVAGAVAVALVLAAVYWLPMKRGGRPLGAECRAVPVAAHIPSVAMDQQRGVAYLAYLDASKRASGRAPRGTVMLMDLNVAEPSVRAALITDPPDFQPIALSLYAPAQGARRLFVIDKGAGAESVVQIFEQSPSGAFERVKTVRDPKFGDANRITANGPESFAVSTRSRGLFQARGDDDVYVNEKARKRLEVLEQDA